MSTRPIDELLLKLQKYITDNNKERAFTLTVEKLVRKVRLDAVGEFNKNFCIKI